MESCDLLAWPERDWDSARTSRSWAAQSGLGLPQGWHEEPGKWETAGKMAWKHLGSPLLPKGTWRSFSSEVTRTRQRSRRGCGLAGAVVVALVAVSAPFPARAAAGGLREAQVSAPRLTGHLCFPLGVAEPRSHLVRAETGTGCSKAVLIQKGKGALPAARGKRCLPVRGSSRWAKTFLENTGGGVTGAQLGAAPRTSLGCIQRDAARSFATHQGQGDTRTRVTTRASPPPSPCSAPAAFQVLAILFF